LVLKQLTKAEYVLDHIQKTLKGRELEIGTVSWIKHIYSKTYNENNNFIGMAIGDTGSGKSYSMIRLAEILDPDFSTERICLDPLKFITLINEKKIPRGGVLVGDEFGVQMGNKSFMSQINKDFSKIFQTCRKSGIIMLMTVPKFGLIDKDARDLGDATFQVLRKIKSEKLTVVKPQQIHNNPRTRNSYYPYLQVNNKTGYVKVKKMFLGLPSTKLKNAYEKIKDEFMNELNQQIYNRLKMVDPIGSLPTNQKRVYDIINNPQYKDITQQHISQLTGIEQSQVSRTLTSLKRKGFVNN
tara:strand:+ start:3991 stop:4884 length:894 start_codon:yes stop_codon:yes gene_type:complete